MPDFFIFHSLMALRFSILVSIHSYQMALSYNRKRAQISSEKSKDKNDLKEIEIEQLKPRVFEQKSKRYMPK